MIKNGFCIMATMHLLMAMAILLLFKIDVV